MVDTITPVVHEGSRTRYLLSLSLHTLGTTAAATAFGAALGAVGALARAPWGGAGAGIVLVVALLYLAREGAGLPVPVPDRHRQVPEWWRTFYAPPVAALLYGLGLGIGFLTFLTFGTFVAVAAGALVSGSPATGALLSAPFGVARGLSLVVGAAWRDATSALDDLAETPWPRTVNALALAGVALAAAAAL